MKIQNIFLKAKYAIVTLIYVLSCIASGMVYSYTFDAKYDSFLTHINVPNEHHYNNGFQSTVVKIKRKTTNHVSSPLSYDDLMNTFYYNKLTNGCRETIDNNVELATIDKIYQIKLFTQQTFRIGNELKDDKFYLIDKNMYYSYFSHDEINSIIGNEHTPHFGAHGFVYISDTLADKLCDQYGITGKNDIDKYKQLITNEQYSVQYFNVDGKENALKLSINSIVSSKHRFAPKAMEIYGDFGLTYISKTNTILNSFSFEIDLKVNQYGNRQTLDIIESLDYNMNNSDFLFLSYDYELKKYEQNASLGNEFYYLKTNHFLPPFFFYLCTSFFSIILLLISFTHNNYSKSNKFFFILNYFLFCIYGVIANYVYFAPFVSIEPILNLIIISIFYSKGIFKNDPLAKKNSSHFEISI